MAATSAPVSDRPSLRELRGMSDEELIRRHDALVGATGMTAQDYRDELRLRMEELRTERLFRTLFWLVLLAFALLVVATAALIAAAT